jgi:YegS/Rv2252/BmrU family lipid kinase
LLEERPWTIPRPSPLPERPFMRNPGHGDAARTIEPPPREIRAAEKVQLLAEIRRTKRAVLVVNTKSRKGQELYATAKRLLEERGYDLKESYPVRDPSRLPEIVEGLVARGEPLVIVGGGDGTISSIVDFLAYRNVALGLLPLGTANSFARGLDIPIDVAGAVDVIVAGKVADVDLGQLNGDLWANSASIGISAAIGRARPNRLKRLLGRVGYVIAAAPAFVNHKPFLCRITHSDRTMEVEALDVLISNGPFHGGVLVAEEADVESRELVVRVIKGRSPWSLVSAWLRIMLRRREPPESLEVVRARELSIEAVPAQYVSIDGEVVTRTPIKAGIAPEALRVMVGTDFAERG